MRLALDLAEKGRGKTGPNPLVGAVVVRRGRIVGSGYHRGSGKPHAEAIALKRAGSGAKDATLYVSLEPCVHVGRTPPCVPQIISAGVRRVVVAMSDPDRRVNGRGLRSLRRLGIKLSQGILEPEARHQNRVYLKNKRHGLPYVILKWAMSLDGKIATRRGDSKWISSGVSRRLVKKMRGEADGVLVGSRTAQLDDPGLRGGSGDGAAVVLDPELTVRGKMKFARGGRSLVVTAQGAGSATRRRELARAGVELIELPLRRGRLPLRQALAKLFDSGMYSLLVEGGGETNAAFLEAGLADELAVFVAPKLIGGREAITPFAGVGIAKLTGALPVKGWTVEKLGPDFLIKGIIKS